MFVNLFSLCDSQQQLDNNVYAQTILKDVYACESLVSEPECQRMVYDQKSNCL